VRRLQWRPQSTPRAQTRRYEWNELSANSLSGYSPQRIPACLRCRAGTTADTDSWRHPGSGSAQVSLSGCALHRWHLRAVAYSDPGFSAAAQAAREARPEDLTPVPGVADSL